MRYLLKFTQFPVEFLFAIQLLKNVITVELEHCWHHENPSLLVLLLFDIKHSKMDRTARENEYILQKKKRQNKSHRHLSGARKKNVSQPIENTESTNNNVYHFD